MGKGILVTLETMFKVDIEVGLGTLVIFYTMGQIDMKFKLVTLCMRSFTPCCRCEQRCYLVV